MKGVIFTTFNKLVEDKFGLDVWDEILDRVDPDSGGIYTTAETYEDAELFSMVGVLSELTGVGVEDLVRAFGEYALEPLTGIYPDSVKEGMTLKEFLKSVDGIIHVEVRKLYPDAALPEFEYEEPTPEQLVMIYRSPRNLPALAEGLIDGAAKLFGQEIERKTIPGEDSTYRIEITFK